MNSFLSELDTASKWKEADSADDAMLVTVARSGDSSAFVELSLVGHLKSGHTWSLQNRPTGLAEDLMILPSLGRFERRHLLADDFAYVPCYLW